MEILKSIKMDLANWASKGFFKQFKKIPIELVHLIRKFWSIKIRTFKMLKNSFFKSVSKAVSLINEYIQSTTFFVVVDTIMIWIYKVLEL